MIGSIVVLGRQWSRGWSLRYEPVVDEDEDEYGTVYVDERGPLRRELTVAWTDGLDLTETDLETLLDVDAEVWTEEASRIPAFFETFEDRMPQALWDQLKALEARLADARSASLAAE